MNTLIEALLDMQHPSEVQLAPDGTQVAFVLGKGNKADGDTPFEKTIYLVDVKTREKRRLTGTHTLTNDQPRWSPDGTRLAFVSNRVNGKEMQLYVLDVRGGEAQALTDLRGRVDQPQWSADGKRVAFLYNGNLDAEKAPEPDPLVMDEKPVFNRVWIVNVEDGSLQAVSPETCHVFEYAWSPDGARFAVLTSPHPNPDEGWYSAQIHVVTAATGEMHKVCHMPYQIGRLNWSPDSMTIGFIACGMSDEGNISGDVFLVDAAGGEARCLTPGIDHSVMWMDWREDGILYGARHIDTTLLGSIDPQSGERRVIAEGEYTFGDSIQRVGASRNGVFAAARESFTEPANVYLGSLDGGEWEALTDLTVDSSVLPPLRVENKHWMGTDGLPVQGFLIYPPDYVPGKKYPLFTHVHGGPSWSFSPRYGSAWDRLMTALGCLVLMPNPRGSWGRGSAYQSANRGDLGGGDWNDIQAGIDCMLDEGLVDPERIAIGGWSYGGYLVTWAVTQTDRFRCAIAGASITNYLSNYGVVKNREWQTAMFGSIVYDEPELHHARSPMTHVKQVKTPTLLVHGSDDVVAPPQQAVEFYTALRHFGVPTQLALYPREPHGFQERAHQRDLYERMVAWVEKYLLSTA